MSSKKLANKEKIKTWYITGASSGIGKALAVQLLDRGYNVVAVARHKPNIVNTRALCHSVDVTNPDDIKDSFEKGIDKFGKIDVLFNNAGISRDATVEEEDIDVLRFVLEVNYFGALNSCKLFVPYFRKLGHGTILTNTSQSGIAPRAFGLSYCTSKHALEALTGVLWLESYRFLRVMSIECGVIHGTNVFNNMKVKETQIKEYQNINNIHDKHGLKKIINNDLTKAVETIINTVENKHLPRRLLIGYDSSRKALVESKYLHKAYRKSKKHNRYINTKRFSRLRYYYLLYRKSN